MSTILGREHCSARPGLTQQLQDPDCCLVTPLACSREPLVNRRGGSPSRRAQDVGRLLLESVSLWLTQRGRYHKVAYTVSDLVALASQCLSRTQSMATAAALKQIEDEIRPLPWSVPETAKPTVNAIEPEILHDKEMVNDGPNYTFDSLRRKVNHDTIKALTLRPFRFANMSEVQYRVLSQMPEIAGIMARPPSGMSPKQWLESLPEGSEEWKTLKDKIENGVEKKDMLVKAKTGTGKTIVSFCAWHITVWQCADAISLMHT